MVKESLYRVLTHAGQTVGSRWLHMWAKMWAHYWSHSNGICYQRVTHWIFDYPQLNCLY